MTGLFNIVDVPSQQGEHFVPFGRASDSGARGWGFDAYLHHVVSLSKDTFTPRNTGNTQEVVAPSQHD